jgi:hypothetical protein
MNEQKALSLSEISQISVNVHDFDRAVAFYKETLGIKTSLQCSRPDGVFRL